MKKFDDEELEQISGMVMDILDATKKLEEIGRSSTVIATAMMSSAIKYAITKIGEEQTAGWLKTAANAIEGSGEKPDWFH